MSDIVEYLQARFVDEFFFGINKNCGLYDEDNNVDFFATELQKMANGNFLFINQMMSNLIFPKHHKFRDSSSGQSLAVEWTADAANASDATDAADAADQLRSEEKSHTKERAVD